MPANKNGRKRIPESVADRSLWQSYLALPAKTRLQLSVALAVFAAGGLVVSDYLEKKIPAQEQRPSEK